jgi:hypothetical protein
MRYATPRLREFAQRLIAYEAGVEIADSPASIFPSAVLVCAKLRPQLAALLGNLGFRTLLARALALATDDEPCLNYVQVRVDGSLNGIDKLAAHADSRTMAQGGLVLLAHLLGLLISFIGEDLTLRLVRQVWPSRDLNDLDFPLGGSHEKTH